MGKFKNLERVVCKELEKLDSDYANKSEFSDVDAKKFDMLAHAWKSYLTAMAMHEANEEREKEMENGQSFARRNISYGAPYMSREMSDGYSGHYPPEWYPVSYAYRPMRY